MRGPKTNCFLYDARHKRVMTCFMFTSNERFSHQNDIVCEVEGLFTWREEDPSARKILEGGST